MAFITKRHLSRRTFLRGAGVTLALPFLDSMLPAGATASAAQSAAAATRPTRFGAIYFPHGAIMPKWTPTTDGANFDLSEILQPLKPFHSRLDVISDLECALAYGSGATANHNRSAAAFLSGAFAKVGAKPELGVTVDQVVARKIGQDTPLPSLELMIEEASINCGDGLSCAYRDTISWQGANSPLPMENNPQVIFERLFGDGNTSEERSARRAQSISLLDSVLGEASSLQRTLPASDRSRLDQYLSDIREIERRIQKAGQALSADLSVPPTPTGIPSDVEEHIKLMFDLQVLAWQADITRVSTLLLAKELSGAVYPKSTIRDAFHTLSHHSNIQANKDRFAILNMYHVALFAYFLDKLQSTPDGDGTLLDHSLVLYGSGMSDGNQHNHTDLPIVLAGGASGRHKGGRHIRNAKKTPMANLHLAILETLQVPADMFGDSTGKVGI
jgi:hypothetical protein